MTGPSTYHEGDLGTKVCLSQMFDPSNNLMKKGGLN